jgi:hypothetical protein
MRYTYLQMPVCDVAWCCLIATYATFDHHENFNLEHINPP